MYFTLEINEQLADILRTATELSVQVNNHIQSKGYKNDVFPGNVLGDMSDKVCEMITNLGDVVGRDIINQAFDEEEKRSTNLNTESHVSK